MTEWVKRDGLIIATALRQSNDPELHAKADAMEYYLSRIKLKTDPRTFDERLKEEKVEAALVNDIEVPYRCTDILNRYHARGYDVVAHSLVHEREGWTQAGYYVGTWTMSQKARGAE